METVKSGLAFYAYLRTIGMFIIGFLFFLCAIGFLFQVKNNNYQKAQNSKVGYYNILNSNKCTDDEKNKNLCKLQLEYSDGSNVYKYDTDPKTQVGETTVFYEQKNPKSYMVTPTPYMFPGGLSCFACIIITIAIIRIIIMKSIPDGAAGLGGLDAVSSLADRLSSNNNSSNNNSSFFGMSMPGIHL